MKKLIIATILLIIISLFFVPPYNELNNLAIIDRIGIEQKDKIYYVYLREVIPTKSDNGISYKYKVYDASTDELENVLDILQDKTKKKLYLKKVKSLITNINSDDIKDKLNIKPESIYHTEEVEKEINP